MTEKNPVERIALESWMKYVEKNPNAAFVKPEDISRIMRATAQEAKIAEMELEEDKNSIGDIAEEKKQEI